MVVPGEPDPLVLAKAGIKPEPPGVTVAPDALAASVNARGEVTIDPAMPRQLPALGDLDIHEALKEHELAEREALAAGKSQADAHLEGLKAEHGYVERATGGRVTPEAYENALAPFVKESGRFKHVPADTLESQKTELKGNVPELTPGEKAATIPTVSESQGAGRTNPPQEKPQATGGGVARPTSGRAAYLAAAQQHMTPDEAEHSTALMDETVTWAAKRSGQTADQIWSMMHFGERGGGELNQPSRGSISFAGPEAWIKLHTKADVTTFIHEPWHFFRNLDEHMRATTGKGLFTADEHAALLKAYDTTGMSEKAIRKAAKDIGIGRSATMDLGTLRDTLRKEREARAWEEYHRSGKFPANATPALQRAFKAISEAFRRIYSSLKADGTLAKLPPDVRAVFDSMYGNKPTLKDITDRRRAGKQARDLESEIVAYGKASDLYHDKREAAHNVPEVGEGGQYSTEFSTTFRDKLPDELADLPINLRKLVNVVKPGDAGYEHATGADSLGELGADEWTRRLEDIAGGKAGDTRHAIDIAQQHAEMAGDYEMLAKIKALGEIRGGDFPIDDLPQHVKDQVEEMQRASAPETAGAEEPALAQPETPPSQTDLFGKPTGEPFSTTGGAGPTMKGPAAPKAEPAPMSAEDEARAKSDAMMKRKFANVKTGELPSVELVKDEGREQVLDDVGNPILFQPAIDDIKRQGEELTQNIKAHMGDEARESFKAKMEGEKQRRGIGKAVGDMLARVAAATRIEPRIAAERAAGEILGSREAGNEAAAQIIKQSAVKAAASRDWDRIQMADQKAHTLALAASDAMEKTFSEIKDDFAKRFTPEERQRTMLLRGKPETDAGKELQRQAREKATPKEKQAAAMLDAMADAAYNQFGESLGIKYRQNYFYGEYENPEKARDYADMTHRRFGGRMFNEKVFPTYADAKGFGMILKTDNPALNLQHEYVTLAQHQAAVDTAAEMLKSGLATEPKKAIGPDTVGWKFVGDQADPYNYFRGLKFHPDIAKLADNMLRIDESLRQSVARGLRKVVSAMRSIKLFVPVFHQMGIAIKGIADTASMAVRLRPVSAAKMLGAVASQGIYRPKFSEVYENKYNSNGGDKRSTMEVESQGDFDRLMTNPDSNIVWKGLRIIPRGLSAPFRAWSRGVFETTIPEIKKAKTFLEVAAREKKLGRPLTDSEWQHQIRTTQNFYGELNERLFGRSGLATSATRFVFMAPGFAEGQFRTVGRTIAGWGQGGRPVDVQSKLMIPLTLITTATLCAVASRIFSGQWPAVPTNKNEFLDLFKIRTGQKGPDGKEVVLDGLTHDRDFMHAGTVLADMATGHPAKAAGDAWDTLTRRIKGMESPAPKLIFDLCQAAFGAGPTDYFGKPIYHSSDTTGEKLKKLLSYESQQAGPIMASTYKQARDKGQGRGMAAITSFMGIRPTQLEKDKPTEAVKLLRDRGYKSDSDMGDEERKRMEYKQQLSAKYKEQGEQALDGADITSHERAAIIKSATQTPLQRAAATATGGAGHAHNLLDALDVATDEEKVVIKPMLARAVAAWKPRSDIEARTKDLKARLLASDDPEIRAMADQIGSGTSGKIGLPRMPRTPHI